MTSEELRDRTMDFAVRILRMTESLPRSPSGRAVANQIARSGTSIAANYRAALRGKSRADFAAKLATVLEEADETEFWLEVIERSELLPARKLQTLRAEANELVRIFSASLQTARGARK